MKLLLSLVFLFLTATAGFAQTSEKLNRDSLKYISLVEFDQLVAQSIHLLETKELKEINDQQHIAIMMCLNTIMMASDSTLRRRFNGGLYLKLELVSDAKKYTRNITQVYTKWTFNRGMGYFFPDLQMELYGTPRLYAWYQVEE